MLEAAEVAERARRRPVRGAARLRRDVRRPPHGPAAGRRHARRPGPPRSPSPTPASTPDEIDYVNAHASSTPIGDVAEARAIALALGERAATVPVSGTKALYGHPLGASGAIEAAICALAIRDGWAPASVNLERAGSRIAAALLPGLLRDGRDGHLPARALDLVRVRRAQRGARVRRRRRLDAPAERSARVRRRRADASPPVGPDGAGPGRTESDGTAIEPAPADPDQRPDAHDRPPARRRWRATRRPRRPRRRPPITGPPIGIEPREDRRVDAHHPAAQAVRDRQLDRRVAGRGHQDRRRSRRGPSAAARPGRTPVAASATSATPRMIAP